MDCFTPFAMTTCHPEFISGSQDTNALQITRIQKKEPFGSFNFYQCISNTMLTVRQGYVRSTYFLLMLINGIEPPNIYSGSFPSHFCTASYSTRALFCVRACALIDIDFASASAEISFCFASS